MERMAREEEDTALERGRQERQEKTEKEVEALKISNEEMRIQILHLEEMLSTKDVQIGQLKEQIHEQKETVEKTLGCEVKQLQRGMEEQKKAVEELKNEDKGDKSMQVPWTEVVKKGKKNGTTG